MSSTIRSLIERLAKDANENSFAEVARRFNALPLYEGWDGWGLLTDQGEVLEADDRGALVPAEEPQRTMYLVVGAERYPDLIPLLPVRSVASIDCARCEGTGWMKVSDEARVRCGECRALGWIE